MVTTSGGTIVINGTIGSSAIQTHLSWAYAWQLMLITHLPITEVELSGTIN